jgi:phosphomannomutase
MVSISGIRGIIGESLTPDIVVKYSAAFAQYCKRGKIIIGRDGRVSGKIIGNIVSSTLLSMGCDVVALGVVPTPTIALAVEKLGATGGIAITASHNPIQWNGMKFIGSSGLFLNAEENKHFWSIADTGLFNYAVWNKIGKHNTDETFYLKHIEAVLNQSIFDVEQIRQRKFKVVIDCINAAGGMIVPQLLRNLGCEVIEMNCDVSGIFSRAPEPVPENLAELCRRVREAEADLGIAVDPDVDRLVLINENGEPFGEEYTITSVVKFILEKYKHTGKPTTAKHKPSAVNIQPSVVINLSTTRAVEDVAKLYHANLFRTPVGEINVASRMKEIGAVVGGEGSGGVILPAVHYGRDAIVGITVILQQLAEFGGALSEFKKTLPQYSISKSKIDISGKNPEQIFEKIRQNNNSLGTINSDDGLKIDFPDSWIHLRKSNTEPIIRIIAEAPTMEQADEIVNKFKNQIG